MTATQNAAADNLSVVRRFMAAIRNGDFSDASSMLHEDFVLSAAGGVPYSGNYYGRGGFVALLTSMIDVLQLTAVRSVQDAARDTTVISRLRLTVTERATGESVDMRVVELYTVDDGLIAGLDVYYKDPQSIAALWTPSRPALSSDPLPTPTEL